MEYRTDFTLWSNKAIVGEIPNLGEDNKARALYELKIREGQGMFEGFRPQEVLPGMTEREILEGLNPEQLLDYRGFLLEKYSDLERQIHLTNDVLDGYGVSYGEDNIILWEN